MCYGRLCRRADLTYLDYVIFTSRMSHAGSRAELKKKKKREKKRRKKFRTTGFELSTTNVRTESSNRL